MIRNTVKERDLKDDNSIKEDPLYWLSKPPEERVAAVDCLRRQYHGSKARVQISVRVIQRPQRWLYDCYWLCLGISRHSRYTGEMNLFVKSNEKNARNIIEALKKFGFSLEGFSLSDFSTPDKVIQLGSPLVRVDIVTLLSGVSWEEVFPGSLRGNTETRH